MCWIRSKPLSRLFGVYIVCTIVSFSSAIPSTTPLWRGVPENALEASKYVDLPPFVFAPGGRLYSVEKVAQEVQSATSNLAIAIVCKEGTVVVSSLHENPDLYVKSSPTDKDKEEKDAEYWEPLYLAESDNSNSVPPTVFCQLDRRRKSPLWACFAGNGVHIQLGRKEVLRICEGMRGSGIGDIEADLVARTWADKRQQPTQLIGKGNGMLSYAGILVGPDTCWRVDPTGQFFKCHAAIAGKGATDAEAVFLQKVKIDLGIEDEDAVVTSAMVKRVTHDWTLQRAKEVALECLREPLKPKRVASSATEKESSSCAFNIAILTVHDLDASWSVVVDEEPTPMEDEAR